VFIELFSLGVTAEALRANIGSKSAISFQRGPVDPKFHLKGVVPTNVFSSQLSYDIKIWTDLSSVLSQYTRVTERQTDGKNILSSLGGVCIPCGEVKMLDPELSPLCVLC